MAFADSAAEAAAVFRRDEALAANAAAVQGGGEVDEGLIVALVAELPGAEVAAEGLLRTQGEKDVDGFIGRDVVVAQPVGAVGADGDEGEVRRAEAAADVLEGGAGGGVADVADARAVRRLQPVAAPEGEVVVG